MMRHLTMQRTMLIALFIILFALATRTPVDTDVWWHLRAGQHILTEGFIYTDPFSFTKVGTPWINHSWAAQIILFGLWQLAGNVGLGLYTAVLATAGMFLLYRAGTGHTYLRAAVLIVGAATASSFWVERPQMFSFLFSTIVIYLLHLARREGRDYLWWIPLLMALWGNLHAGYSIGFILLLGTIIAESAGHLLKWNVAQVMPWPLIRKLSLVTALSVAAVMINPYGPQILSVPFATVGISFLREYVNEWNRPDFTQPLVWPFLVMLVLTVVLGFLNRKRITITDVCLCLGTAGLALLAGRNIATFAVVAIPVLMYWSNDLLEQRGWVLYPIKRVSLGIARLNAVFIGIVAFVCLIKIVGSLNGTTVTQAQRDFLPVRLTEYLRDANLPGPMFNSYNWGGYLMFALPEQPVYVDGRTDLYGDSFLRHDYLPAAVGDSEWQSILDHYAIQLVVMEPESGLTGVLRQESSWQLRYEDEQAVVFTRGG
jgi:hypothetical protein